MQKSTTWRFLSISDANEENAKKLKSSIEQRRVRKFTYVALIARYNTISAVPILKIATWVWGKKGMSRTEACKINFQRATVEITTMGKISNQKTKEIVKEELL